MSKAVRTGWSMGGQALASGLALGAVLGCSDDSATATSNLELWKKKGPSSYTYIVETSCFCAAVEPVRVVVVEGMVAESVGMNTGLPRDEYAVTMTTFLENVRAITKKDPSDFDADYDAELGYVKRVSVDYSSGAADDEFSTVVSCFIASTEAAACPLPTPSSCQGEVRSVNAENPLYRTCDGGLLPTGRVDGTDQVCCPAR
jgi:hypothetical protein